MARSSMMAVQRAGGSPGNPRGWEGPRHIARPGGWPDAHGARSAGRRAGAHGCRQAGRCGCGGGGARGVASPPPGRDLHVCVAAPDFLLLLRCRYARAGPGGRAAGAQRRGHLLTRTPGRAAPPPALVAASPPWPPREPGSEVGVRPSSTPDATVPVLSLAARP
jgi:hypothetical protein